MAGAVVGAAVGGGEVLLGHGLEQLVHVLEGHLVLALDVVGVEFELQDHLRQLAVVGSQTPLQLLRLAFHPHSDLLYYRQPLRYLHLEYADNGLCQIRQDLQVPFPLHAARHPALPPIPQLFVLVYFDLAF